MTRFWILSCAMAVLAAPGSAAPVDYVRDVRPILQKRCYRCHGEKRQKSGLRLDVKAAAFKGGSSHGPAIVPRQTAKSPLIRLVSHSDPDLRMPPSGNGLSPKEITTLTQWVKEGAAWPDNVDVATIVDQRNHWSLKRLQDPVIPEPREAAWARNGIDRFILARLQSNGLSHSDEASRSQWLRRVSFDLIGLPPSPEELKRFLHDQRPDAYERAVDRLLSSPRYGERWAQHWLDVVRYADTHGFEVNTERPHSWPYRDYVIAAFNKDTPYDQFIREQIVGDAIGRDAATGFLVTASVLLPGQIGKDAPSIRLARQDALDEIVVNISQTFLGLSVGCARCHDHMFDAISQKDYYSMQAFVAGVEYGDRQVKSRNGIATAQRLRREIASIDRQLAAIVPAAQSGVVRSPVNAIANIERIDPVTTTRLRFTILSTNNREPCIDELEVFDSHGNNIAPTAMVSASGSKVSPNRHELRFINDGAYGNSRSWMSSQVGKGWVELRFQKAHQIGGITWGRDRQGKFSDRLAIDYRIEVATPSGQWQTVAGSKDRKPHNPRAKSQPVEPGFLRPEDRPQAQKLLAKKKPLESRLRSFTGGGKLIFAGKFRKPDRIHLLRRGDPEQPLEPVAPAVLEALGKLRLPDTAPEQQRRKALADWIADPRNPLTARVMVNRIWQGHFGTGLVDTPNDFGRNGSKPSHPGLLDWLATELIRSQWSIKHLHRLIVLSATYRQSTLHNAQAAGKDAQVRLLWRYPTRRLEGEAIRDSILSVSGRLNLKMGGSGFNLFDKRGGLTGFKPVVSFDANGLRRMIYAHRVRRERDAVFGAFDCPDAGQSMPRRRESTTPIQALNLLNSRFIIDQAKAFAARIKAEVGTAVDAQIQRAYQLVLSRNPDEDELRDARPVVAGHGLVPLCRALFNCNELLFVP